MQLTQFLLVFLMILSGFIFSQEPATPEPGEVPITPMFVALTNKNRFVLRVSVGFQIQRSGNSRLYRSC